jgi:P pilus assembly chaperone PapD
MRALLLSAVALGLTSSAAAQTPAAQAPAPQTAQIAVTNVGANVNITPKRVYLDKTRRSSTVYILNQGNQEVTVDLALVDRVMFPSGQIMIADEARKQPEGGAIADKLKSAKEILQISPRRVTMAPGKGQTIRLRLAGLPDSGATEFRSHLTVTTIPPRDTGTTAQAAANAPNQELRFQVSAVYGVSIPVIVRAGAPDVRAGIENVKLEYAEVSADGRGAAQRTPVVAMDLVRVGANSLYGNFEVRTVGQKRGEEPIGVARGVAVYEEAARRTVRIPLTRAPAAGEKLEVTFTDDDTSPGKVLAKAAS